MPFAFLDRSTVSLNWSLHCSSRPQHLFIVPLAVRWPPFDPMTIYQWCSRDRNLRDRDLVKISRRDRDFIKNSETRDFKICAFCRIFFRRVLVVSYLKIQQTKNRWIIEILINHFFAIFKVSRPETFETETRPETFETETRKNESRDRDQVSRLHHCYLSTPWMVQLTPGDRYRPLWEPLV